MLYAAFLFLMLVAASPMTTFYHQLEAQRASSW
jgi:hypothetical protein